jgi:hypothetical protein
MIESFLIETNMVHTIELKREDIQKKKIGVYTISLWESLYNIMGSKINERGGWNYNWIFV